MAGPCPGNDMLFLRLQKVDARDERGHDSVGGLPSSPPRREEYITRSGRAPETPPATTSSGRTRPSTTTPAPRPAQSTAPAARKLPDRALHWQSSLPFFLSERALSVHQIGIAAHKKAGAELSPRAYACLQNCRLNSRSSSQCAPDSGRPQSGSSQQPRSNPPAPPQKAPPSASPGSHPAATASSFPESAQSTASA